MFDQTLADVTKALSMFERGLTAERPTDLGGFIRGRLDLSRAVHKFFAEEWSSLGQSLSAFTSEDIRAKQELHRSFVTLRADYSNHVRIWDSKRLVEQWAEYRSDCQHLIRTMRALLHATSAQSFARAG